MMSQPGIDLRTLSDAQLDGRACCRCGGESGPMQPITLIVGVQMFVHYSDGCAAPATVDAA